MYGDALERKLVPIYDAIDGGSHKNALKHTEAALRKFPGNQLLRALRAYALHKYGRVNAAAEELESLVRDGPENERVLHTMSFTLKALGRGSDITAAYEGAAQKRPGDLDIMIGLFGAYAKEMNFAKQQQTALKIAKLHPSKADQCVWWAITSVALQARAAILAQESVLASQLMKLAETMANKQMSKASVIVTYEMLLMYIDVLQGQGKGEEACKALSKAGEATPGGLQEDRLQLEAAALCRAGELEAAATLYYQACTADGNDWNSWHLYLDCVIPKSAERSQRKGVSCYPVGVVGGLAESWDFQMGLQLWSKAGDCQGSREALEAVKRAQDALQSLSDKVSQDSKTRGARGVALASLELMRRQQKINLLKDPGIEMVTAIANALPALIDYKSCMSDIRNYIHCINPNDHEALSHLASKVKGIADDRSDAIMSQGHRNAREKCYQCLINKHVLIQYLKWKPEHCEEDGGSGLREASSYFELYVENKHLSESLDPKERGHGEELVELAVKVLVENRSKANDSDSTDDVMWSLLVAVLILESVQIRRTVSSPLRLASCAIYGLLYAPDIAAVHFSSLDIKGILHETLTGHWMVPILLAASASSKQVQKWLDGIGNIHEQQLSEAADAFFTAFENGSYSKVPEMVDFWETLRNSSSSAIWRTESSIQSLQKAVGDVEQLRKAAEESSASLQSIELDRLYYVEDLSTRPSWFPPLPAISITTAIGDWWQCQGKASNRWPWWHHMVAGERECEEALNWRSAMEKGLRRRISLTKILSMLLSPKPLSEEDLMEGKRVVQEAWGTKVEMEGSTNDSRGTPPLLPVLFETGFAIHRFARCAANSHSDTMADDMSTHCVAARSALSVLVESSSQVCRHLADALTRKEGQCTALILPANASIAFASELVSEHMAWISSCFVSWRKLMDELMDELMDDDSKIQLLNELRQASSSLDASVQFLMHALQSCVDIDIHAAAKDLVKELEGRLDGCSALWEHESEFDAESAIAKLLKAQKGTANRLIESGERVLKNLKLVKQLTK